MPLDAVVDDPLDFVEEDHLGHGRRLARARRVQLHHRRRQLFRLVGDDAKGAGVIDAMIGGVEIPEFCLEDEGAQLRS